MTHTTSSGIFSIRYGPRLCFVRMCPQAIPALPFQPSYWALARRRHAEPENAPHSPGWVTATVQLSAFLDIH